MKEKQLRPLRIRPRLLILLAASVVLLGCVSIQSPPMILNNDLHKTSVFITEWVGRTFRQQATMFGGDAVAYEYIPENLHSGRIELRWSAPDIRTRLVFAVITLKEIGRSHIEVTVREEKNNVPLTHRYQDVASKLRAEFERAGVLIR